MCYDYYDPTTVYRKNDLELSVYGVYRLEQGKHSIALTNRTRYYFHPCPVFEEASLLDPGLYLPTMANDSGVKIMVAHLRYLIQLIEVIDGAGQALCCSGCQEFCWVFLF
jgi:hypothetical protein